MKRGEGGRKNVAGKKRWDEGKGRGKGQKGVARFEREKRFSLNVSVLPAGSSQRGGQFALRHKGR